MTAGAATLKRGRAPILRCPACGNRFEQPAPPKCDLCGFEIDGGSATGADLTPYAQAYARGEGAWLRMLEWVWFAGSERIRHAALLRASAASRRFAQLNCVLLAVAVTIVQLINPQTCWHWSKARNVEPTDASGWVQVAVASQPTLAGSQAPVALWWSVPQAAMTAALSLATALFVIWLTLVILGLLIEAAHLPNYRGEYRMSAAMHYSTAWVIPLVVAALIAGLSPLGYAGDITGASWTPSPATIQIAAGTVGGLGLFLWWFWLVRVAVAAPIRTRTRVATFFAVGVPLVAAAMATGWYVGLWRLSEVLVESFKLSFV